MVCVSCGCGSECFEWPWFCKCMWYENGMVQYERVVGVRWVVMDVVWVRDEKVVVWDGRDGIAGWMWRGRGTGVEWAWDLSGVGVGWSWDVCTMAKMGARWEWSERGVEVGWKSVLLNVEWTVLWVGDETGVCVCNGSGMYPNLCWRYSLKFVPRIKL